MKEDIRIEYPSSGATYTKNEYGVYQYSKYPGGSVLASQQRRQWLDSFKTLKEAQTKYPRAKLCGCGFQAPSLSHLPDDGDY